MIAYIDTSALIPLFGDEPASDVCGQVWDAATRVVGTPLAYPRVGLLWLGPIG